MQTIKLMAGAALMACASTASAADYIRYEVLTAGSGTYSDARSGTSLALTNMGFTFVVDLTGFTSVPLSNGVAFRPSSFDLGWLPGTATATFSGALLSLSDRSSDHTFAVDACSAAPLSSLPTDGFATTTGCSNAVAMNTQSSRGFVYNYAGLTTEIRATAFTSTDNIATGLVLLSAVPEPTTWAMMLLGFGMVAGAARYRRRSMSATLA